MKTWPLFWQNQHFKKIGMALLGSCLSFPIFSQSTPLATPTKTDYPGIIESFEKLISIDQSKLNKKNDLLSKSGATLQNTKNVTEIELDPDFLNSVILHSDAGYVKLASSSKCMFYHTIINDLLKNSQGKIDQISVTYLNSKQERESALVSKKDFLNKLAYEECPETPKLIDQFQVKNLDKTVKETSFASPTGLDQCRNVYLEWLNSSKTPYYCKVHDYIQEAEKNLGDPKDLVQRKAVSKILVGKLKNGQLDFIQNFCDHISNEKLFCANFLTSSFWTKIGNNQADKIYLQNICAPIYKTSNLSEIQINDCINRIKKDNDLCLYPNGRSQGLKPSPQCDTLSTALTHSALKSNYYDCPANSDQLTITHLSRILMNISKGKSLETTAPCSAISTFNVLEFNKKFNNDERWKLEACYDDKLFNREVCAKTFFGDFNDSEMSYTKVVANILRKTRGAELSLKCEMIDSEEYNPLLLKFKSGCYIVYDRNKCFISECSHKVLYNDRSIDIIRLKNRAPLDLFPVNVQEEKFSQHYLLTNDFKQRGRILTNLTNINNYYKRSKSKIIHGVGCAENLLPSFFKSHALNQCTPLPFIIDGMIKESDKVTFVVRTAADSLQAPRLINWSLIFSGVKGYQRNHPLKHWTLYGLD